MLLIENFIITDFLKIISLRDVNLLTQGISNEILEKWLTAKFEWLMTDEIVKSRAITSDKIYSTGHIAVLVVNYGISNTIVLEIP